MSPTTPQDVATVLDMPVKPDTATALRRAGEKVEGWTQRRDELVRAAIAQGGTLRQVGELAGLSHTAVSFIANGRPKR